MQQPFILYSFLWPPWATCETLFRRPELELVPSAGEAWACPSRWTTRDVPLFL